jgi:hypothetical protein
VLVLALPRGGIEVAEPIAEALGADLDVFVSRKIRAPDQPELAIGAIAEGDVVLWNEPIVRSLGLDRDEQQRALEQARRDLERVATYRAVAPRAPLEGRTLVVADDGVATGATLKAALKAPRARARAPDRRAARRVGRHAGRDPPHAGRRRAGRARDACGVLGGRPALRRVHAGLDGGGLLRAA